MSSEAGEGSSASTAPKKEQMDAQANAINLLAQGKRNLICQEIPIAVQQFQDACQILSTQFGEMARECAEAYFSYGSALLDLSRMEQDVLGNALEGVDVDADEEGGPNNKEQFESTERLDEEERMELRVKVVEAMSEDEISNQAFLATGKRPGEGSKSGEPSFSGTLKAAEKENVMATEDGDEAKMEEGSGRAGKSSPIEKKVAEIDIGETGDEVDGGEGMEEMETGDTPKDKKPGTEEEGEEEEEEDEEEEGGSQEEEEGEGEAGSQEEGQESDDADDVSNLQLSWEMLDLAKIIYSKDPSKESQLKAAEAHLKLGEVSLESEQYDQAISDLESCLDIQKQHLEPCDRAIALTYYQLGLAYQLNKQMDKAQDIFTSALTCLEIKMEKLNVIVKEKPPKSPSQVVEPAESAEQEIKEILELIPEIREKIKDVEDENKSMENIKLMAKHAMGTIFAAAADSTSEVGFAGTSSSSSPVESAEPQKTMDISHLIRKKRKPEDEKKEELDTDSKKQKQESGSGDASINGVHEQVSGSTSEAMAAT